MFASKRANIKCTLSLQNRFKLLHLRKTSLQTSIPGPSLSFCEPCPYVSEFTAPTNQFIPSSTPSHQSYCTPKYFNPGPSTLLVSVSRKSHLHPSSPAAVDGMIFSPIYSGAYGDGGVCLDTAQDAVPYWDKLAAMHLMHSS